MNWYGTSPRGVLGLDVYLDSFSLRIAIKEGLELITNFLLEASIFICLLSEFLLDFIGDVLGSLKELGSGIFTEVSDLSLKSLEVSRFNEFTKFGDLVFIDISFTKLFSDVL